MTDLLAQPRVDLASRSREIRAAIAISTDAAAMSALAAISGVLYLVNLTVSGNANTYYAMAAQAASQSWSAMFFGALDSQGFITIDKPPLATWVMGLSVKVLGLSHLVDPPAGSPARDRERPRSCTSPCGGPSVRRPHRSPGRSWPSCRSRC